MSPKKGGCVLLSSRKCRWSKRDFTSSYCQGVAHQVKICSSARQEDITGFSTVTATPYDHCSQVHFMSVQQECEILKLLSKFSAESDVKRSKNLARPFPQNTSTIALCNLVPLQPWPVRHETRDTSTGRFFIDILNWNNEFSVKNVASDKILFRQCTVEYNALSPYLLHQHYSS